MTRRVLIVKQTSMGDLIHSLPALTDARRAFPDIQFDWVSDRAFADIPKFHPAVDTVIHTAHRHWRKNKKQAWKNGEIQAFWRALRAKKYDVVLDAQGNFRSALISLIARGLRCGADKKGVHESPAHLFYQKRFPIPSKPGGHSVARTRELFAQALGYPIPTTPPDFGIDLTQLPQLTVNLPKPYLVFIHSTTWSTKHWPERYWADLIRLATAANYHVVLPWGNAQEEERSKRLAEVSDKAMVLPRLRIAEQASVLRGAAGAVTVDTGLGHLIGALERPGLMLLGPTAASHIGLLNENSTNLIAPYPAQNCAPCYLKQCKYGDEPQCFVTQLKAEAVWEALKDKLEG